IAVPGIEQLAIFRDQHMHVEPFPIDVLIACVQMPPSFGRLVLDQSSVRQHRSNIVAVAHHPWGMRILGADSFQKFYREIMRVAVDIHSILLQSSQSRLYKRTAFKKVSFSCKPASRCPIVSRMKLWESGKMPSACG